MLPVFLSWSGNSRPVAALLNDWLPQVLHAIRPWYSDEDIAKGARSIAAVESALASTTFGIICVTQKNYESPWLNYEAGMLARVLSASRVTPFLIDLAPANLKGPLANLQATTANKRDVRRLILSLNASLDDDNRLPQTRLEKSFERWWPDLEASLQPLSSELNSTAEARRPAEHILDDLFIAAKQMQRDLRRITKRIDAVPVLPELPVAFAGRTDEPAPGAGRAAPPGNSQPDGKPPAIYLGDRSNFPNLGARLSSANEFWAVGKSLSTLTVENYEALSAFARDGNLLKLAILDPADQQLTSIAARSLYGIGSAEELGGDIRATLGVCSRLRDVAAVSSYVEVRLLKLVPSFAMTYFGRGPGDSEIVTELYPFRVTSPRRPHFSIFSGHPWYRFFVDQIQTVWESAGPIDRAGIEELIR